MVKKDIHLVKAAFHAQFKATMENCGLSTDYYFRKVGLPGNVSDPESLLPLKPFFHLINVVAIDENIPDFGSQVAQTTPWHEVSSLGPLLRNSMSLKDLLETFCEIASGQSSIVNFTLIDQGSDFDFCYTDVPLYKGDIQMELYRITSMIQLVQLATGTGWRSKTIRLNMPKTVVVNVCPLIKNSEIKFSQSDSAISIPVNLLRFPLRLTISRRGKPGSSPPSNLSTEITNSIRQVISTYTLTGNISIGDVAKISDMSVRSLQRRLSESGLKYSELLNQAKFDHAQEMLRDLQMTVKEVANSLGYSDPAHFTRAFRRWSGLSPINFRKQQLLKVSR
jgi:AraC-like DNA-binding protein